MNILVFGDSITQGFHDDERGGWVGRLFSYCVSEMIRSDYEKYVSVFNLGISGERSCDLIKRFNVEFDTRQQDGMATIFAIGINDSARNIKTDKNWCDINDYKNNLQQMINQAKIQGGVVLLGLTAVDESKLTPIPWFSEYSHHQSDRDRYDNVSQRISP